MPKTIEFENAKLKFRNFAGRENDCNNEGDRNFCIELNEEEAQALIEQGINVKPNKREDGKFFVKINVSYKFGDPEIYLIDGDIAKSIKQSGVARLDRLDFEKVDVIATVSHWSRNGREGNSLYLETLCATLVPSKIRSKYSHLTFVDDTIEEVPFD